MASWMYLAFAASVITTGVKGVFRMEVVPERVEEGEQVRLICHVIGEDTRVTVVWYRVNIPEHTHHQDILAVNEVIRNSYVQNRKPGPYQMDGFTSEGEDVVYTMTISGAQLEDNAQFGCGLRDSQGDNHVRLTVTKLPDAIYWYSQRTPMTREDAAGMAPYEPNQLIQTSETSHGYFMCVADGFIPTPNMIITFNGKKLDDFRTIESVSTVTSPTHPAFSYLVHQSVTTATSQFVMTQDNNSLPLTCTASVYGQKVQATVRLVLQAPTWLTCQDASVPTGMRLAKLTCLVEADPEVDLLKWTWNDAAGDTVNVIAGKTLDGNYSSTREVRGGRIETSLVIDRVYPEMFRDYYLYVRDSTGHQYEKLATLKRDEVAERNRRNGGSAAHPAVGLVCLVAFVLWPLTQA